jgi:membrane protease YdiL (CAAX protease family)
MAGELTSPQSPGVWRQFGAFLRHPQLPDRVSGIRASALPALGKLFALDLLLMFGLLAVAGIASVLGFEMPPHMIDEMGLTTSLILFILIGAPIGEEVLFRGWLSGRLGHVLGVIVLALGTLVATGFYATQVVPFEAHDLIEAMSKSVAYGLLTALPIALLPVYLFRSRLAMQWFQRHFRWFYLGSALAFASIHLTNFTEGNALILLPLTLPQFLLGLILGYVRVTYGLWANILLHAAHNSLFVAAILIGSAAA